LSTQPDVDTTGGWNLKDLFYAENRVLGFLDSLILVFRRRKSWKIWRYNIYDRDNKVGFLYDLLLAGFDGNRKIEKDC